MSYPGFNIKVRQVSNGYTVHRTTVPGGKAAEDHDDHVATDLEGLRTLLDEIVADELSVWEVDDSGPGDGGDLSNYPTGSAGGRS